MRSHRSSRQVLTRQFCPCALAVLLSGVASPISAQSPRPIWATVARIKNAVVEIDRDRVHRLSPRFADAWTRVTYSVSDTLDDGQRYQSVVQHAVFDCTDRRYLVAQLVAFAGDGRIVKVLGSNATDAWVPVPPNSVADAERKGACDSQLG